MVPWMEIMDPHAYMAERLDGSLTDAAAAFRQILPEGPSTYEALGHVEGWGSGGHPP